MKINLTDHVLRLAHRAPSAERRLAIYSSIIREGRASAARTAAHSAPTGGIPVHKGNILPPEADFRIHFVSSQKPRPKPVVGQQGHLTKKQPPGLLAEISQKDIQELQSMEPELLKWITASKENAARFFADPMGSLELADIQVSRRLRLRILASRKRTSFVCVKLPPVRIQSINVGG